MIVQIKITDKQLDKFKSFSNQATAAKAILYTADLAVSQSKSNYNLEEINHQLLDDLNKANVIIQNLQAACRATLDYSD